VLYDLSLNFQTLLIFPAYQFCRISMFWIINLKKQFLLVTLKCGVCLGGSWHHTLLRDYHEYAIRPVCHHSAWCGSTQIHTYVYFCNEPFCWHMLTNLQSYVTGLQLRSMETGPKRLGVWSWQGYLCGNKFSIFLAHIYIYIHLLLEYFRVQFIASWLSNVTYSNTVGSTM
jgi:hypothetical protein